MSPNQSSLCDAIHQRRSVSLWYGGRRIVDPYIVYESSTGTVLVDAYQTSGHSESGQSVGWKRFEVQQITSVQILSQTFSARADYNPSNRERYVRIICKI